MCGKHSTIPCYTMIRMHFLVVYFSLNKKKKFNYIWIRIKEKLLNETKQIVCDFRNKSNTRKVPIKQIIVDLFIGILLDTLDFKLEIT